METLPNEMLYDICKTLPDSELARMVRTSKDYYDACYAILETRKKEAVQDFDKIYNEIEDKYIKVYLNDEKIKTGYYYSLVITYTNNLILVIYSQEENAFLVITSSYNNQKKYGYKILNIANYEKYTDFNELYARIRELAFLHRSHARMFFTKLNEDEETSNFYVVIDLQTGKSMMMYFTLDEYAMDNLILSLPYLLK